MMGSVLQSVLPMMFNQIESVKAQFVPSVSAQIMVWPHQGYILLQATDAVLRSTRQEVRDTETGLQSAQQELQACDRQLSIAAADLHGGEHDHDQAESPEVRTMVCRSSC